MRKPRVEVVCSADTVHCLGVLQPRDMDEHRALRDAGHLMVRDRETMSAFFWPWQLPEVAVRSS